MNKILMLVILLPIFGFAQANYSANELAHETVKTYIEKKLFPGETYKPGNFGKLRALDRQRNEYRWYLKHEFEILQSKYLNNEKIIVLTKHIFNFFLDRKMNVVKAETIRNF